MAYTKKNVKPADTVIEVSESVETKPEKKKFDKEETIICKSITDGLLLVRWSVSAGNMRIWEKGSAR